MLQELTADEDLRSTSICCQPVHDPAPRPSLSCRRQKSFWDVRHMPEGQERAPTKGNGVRKLLTCTAGQKSTVLGFPDNSTFFWAICKQLGERLQSVTSAQVAFVCCTASGRPLSDSDMTGAAGNLHSCTASHTLSYTSRKLGQHEVGLMRFPETGEALWRTSKAAGCKLIG